MARPRCAFASTSFSFLLFVFLLGLGSRRCHGFGPQFGFDIHHRFSDPVKGILGVEKLPAKGSVEYYATMAHRDRVIRGRHLAASTGQSSALTFANGNDTYFFSSLGYLHYANISVGTPSLSFIVALDTGSDLFWLPCDCTKGGCVPSLLSSKGKVLPLNIYNPNSSSTYKMVPCNNSLCTSQCPSASSSCPYQIKYLSSNTSSTGILVEDVLHLITDDDQQKAIDAPITFGCGQTQTGTFLEGAAPNGLFGLGMDDTSVPSILAKNGITSNSFSMCFGLDGVGRITFGNNGSSGQKETPFNDKQSQLYNISVTYITVEQNSSAIGFSAIFDSGTSFTSLTDPAYTYISESFNSQVQETRHPSDSQTPFEYCYDLSANQDSYVVPSVNLTMKGGDIFSLYDPTVLVSLQNGGYVYCLALLKSEDINIIGQNFMTGYQFIFDRDRMVLGWKDSNCYNQTANNPAGSPAHSPGGSPALAVNPQATENTGNTSSSSSNHSPKFMFLACTLILLFASFFAIA